MTLTMKTISPVENSRTYKPCYKAKAIAVNVNSDNKVEAIPAQISNNTVHESRGGAILIMRDDLLEGLYDDEF